MKFKVEVDDRDYIFELDNEILISYQSAGINIYEELKRNILENKLLYKSERKVLSSNFKQVFKSYLKRKDSDTVLED